MTSILKIQKLQIKLISDKYLFIPKEIKSFSLSWPLKLKELVYGSQDYFPVYSQVEMRMGAWGKFKHVNFNNTLPYIHKRLCPLNGY